MLTGHRNTQASAFVGGDLTDAVCTTCRFLQEAIAPMASHAANESAHDTSASARPNAFVGAEFSKLMSGTVQQAIFK